MIGSAHEVWCYIVVSSLWHTVQRNDICDVAVPCGFAGPLWKVRLRECAPAREGKHAGVNAACRWRAG